MFATRCRKAVVLLPLFVAISSLLAVPQTPTPALLVLNKDDSQLAIVDPASLKVVARVPTGEAPHEIAASGDGKYAVVTNYGPRMDGTTLSVIDIPAAKEIHRVDLTPLRSPHGVQFIGQQAYFTVEGSKAIARYDPASNKVDWVLGIGQNRTHMLHVSADGSRIFTSNVNSDSITAIQRVQGPDAWNEVNIAVGKGPEGFDVSPDGKEVWTANSHDGTVSIIDTATLKVTQTVNVDTKQSNRLKFTPDGKLVLISDIRGGDLLVIDAATRKQVKRLHLGRGAEGILIAPDGSKAYVAVSPDNKLAIVDLKTLAVTGTIETGRGPDGMAWAPAQH